ncbi:MAG: EAL domain-containing protein [Sandaracinaceae bacterium]
MEPLMVLIVDDDASMRRLMQRTFEADSRVRATCAADGLEALRILEDGVVDVLISDEVMPGISGVRLLETVRARWPGVRRVLYTGYPDADIVIQAVNRGGVHRVLLKSPHVELTDSLAEIVDDALAKRTSPISAPPSGRRARSEINVLVVHDHLALQTRYEAALGAFRIRFASPGTAIGAHERDSADVVVLDISDGADPRAFLEALRAADLDCPVVVTAPRGAIDAAHSALRHGAYLYVLHPFTDPGLSSAVRQAAAMRRIALLRREANPAPGEAAWQLSDRASLQVRFRRALDELYMVYQPIVSHSNRKLVGYEALVRSAEPTLPHPGALFDAARRLDRVEELGRAIRRVAPAPVRDLAPDTLLFVNLDVRDIDQEDLLTAPFVDMAERIVLEVTERAALDAIDEIAARISILRTHGFRIAVDDLGAGYAGLTSFAALQPDIVKLDMSLIRDIHEAPVKQRLVASLQEACDDLHVWMVAEGVESVHELRALQAAGCDVFQGYLFARPARAFPEVAWN